MVRLITDIQQNNLPTVSNSFSPNPLWRTTDSFDYQQYYDKKKGIRTFQQARNKANCKPDENFKLGLFAATGGIFLLYVVDFIMSFFGSGISFLDVNNSSSFSIGVSLFIVVIASLNLVIDFDFIEEGSEKGAPKFMEWYGAFGLLVTLIWLYLEILRMLAKLKNR